MPYSRQLIAIFGLLLGMRLPAGLDFISNHDNFPGRHAVREFRGERNRVVDLGGGTIWVDEPAIAVHIDGCENLTLRNGCIDWRRPVLSEGLVIAITNGETVARFDPVRYPLSIENGECFVTGPGGRHDRLLSARFLDGADFSPVVLSREVMFGGVAARDLGHGEIAFAYDASKNRVKAGDVIVLRPRERPYPAVFIENSKNIVLEDVVVRDAFGMALIAQMSENVTWRGTSTAGAKTSGVIPRQGAHVSAHADASHFSNVAGMVRVENCWFEGMMDDAINVHSTCLQITNFTGVASFRCCFRHPQATGFEVFRAGDRVRFIRGRTNEDGPEATVASVRRLSDTELEVTLSAAVPVGVEIGDTVENADYQCAAVFRGNVVRNNRARGCLFTTPKPVVCESNRFEQCTGPAVVMSSDAFYWFESGHCRDVLISGNVISNCLTAGYGVHGSSYGLISVDPSIHDLAAQRDFTHRNIRIIGNRIFTSDLTLLYAKSVKGLVWKGNRVEYSELMPSWHRPPFVTIRCEEMEL